MLRLALPGWIQPSASGLAPRETPAVMPNQLTGGCGPHLQGWSSVGGGAPDGMCGAEGCGKPLEGRRGNPAGEALLPGRTLPEG